MQFCKTSNESEINSYQSVVKSINKWMLIVAQHNKLDDSDKVYKTNKLQVILDILNDYEIKE